MNGLEGFVPPGLDEFVELYEAERLATGTADILRFLPELGHPDYHQIVAELIRVDLEYTWAGGSPKCLEDYRQRFSKIFENRCMAAEIAYEEFRQRRRAGEQVSREEYARRYAIDVSAWPSDSSAEAPEHSPAECFPAADDAGARRHESRPDVDSCELPQTQPGLRSGPSDSSLFEIADLQSGGRFAGFEIVQELGRGSFARAYLARQSSLANRLVVLKVTTEQTFEPDRLARL